MKKFIVLVLAVMLSVGFAGSAWSQAGAGQKGPSARAFEKASDESALNRVGDWFATRGKSEQEKQAILAERKAKRTAEKMKKEAEKKSKEMKAKMDKAGKDMGKGLKLPKK
ncbi:MAG TPA: hypothetical protein PKZ41_01775 [Candidatus Omnitrophota bacterium]|nr:hypothetical protein [Candidatus Omnitrophota bacterium]